MRLGRKVHEMGLVAWRVDRPKIIWRHRCRAVGSMCRALVVRRFGSLGATSLIPSCWWLRRSCTTSVMQRSS